MTLLRISILFCLLLLNTILGAYQYFDMHWQTNGQGYYYPENGVSVTCSSGTYILVLNAYRRALGTDLDLSLPKRTAIINKCNCTDQCYIPKLPGRMLDWFGRWKLKIVYECTVGQCSTDAPSISTVSSTSKTNRESSSRTSRSITTTTMATNRESSSSTSRNVTTKMSTEKISPSDTTTQTVISNSTPIVTSLKPANTSTFIVPVSNKTTTPHGNASHSSDIPQSDVYKASDTSDKTVVIAVSVISVFALVIGALLLGFLLYRRWRRIKLEDGVYCNRTNNTTENDRDGFTNRTYSKALAEANEVDHQFKSDDAHSHSGDSGYTDMHTEDHADDSANDYYMIKDGVEEATQNDNDGYYAIKDNVSNEYNKIAFSPKLIPEDPNYGHTVLVANIKDKTYDHVDGKDLKVNESFEDTDLQDDDYSHLNQSKTNMRHISFGKTIESDTVKSELDKKKDGNTTGHEYFILEQNESSTQAKYHKEDDESHKYFVLDKEISKKDTLKNGNKTDESCNAIPVVKGRDLTTSCVDHTYFENCQLVDTASDTHQYQAIEPQVSENKSEMFEDENHDYFVLEKEIKT